MNPAPLLFLLGLLSVLPATAPRSSALTGNIDQPEAGQDTIVVDFENYPANRVGSPSAAGDQSFYRDVGLLFDRPVTGLVYDDQSIPADPDFARSGSVVITTCYAAEFCSNDIAMTLLTPHRLVQVWAGYDGPLQSPAGLILEGFDREGVVVAGDRVTLGTTATRLPVETPLLLDDPLGRITAVRLRWADSDRFLSRLSIDDIELTPFVAAPAAEFDPTSVRLEAEDGTEERALLLVNSGNVALSIAAVDLELEPGTDSGGAIEVDGSDCLGSLEPNAGCPVLVSFQAPAETGGLGLATVTAIDETGRVVAEATVEAVGTVVADPTTDTTITDTTVTDTTTDTTAIDPTIDPTAQEPTAGRDGDGLDPTIPVGGLAILLVAAGLLLVRRLRRRRRARPTHSPERPPQRAPPRPTVHSRLDGEATRVNDDGRPSVSIRAAMRFEPGDTTLTMITADDRPSAPTDGREGSTP